MRKQNTKERAQSKELDQTYLEELNYFLTTIHEAIKVSKLVAGRMVPPPSSGLGDSSVHSNVQL